MRTKKEPTRRYSRWIRPIVYVIDLIIIVAVLNYFLKIGLNETIYILSFWVLLSIIFSFYNIYRYTNLIKIVSLITRQIIVFELIVIAYFYFINHKVVNDSLIFSFLFLLVVFILWRAAIHTLLRKYRIITGSNFRKVVIIGQDSSTERLKSFFEKELEYGYRLEGVFSDKYIENKTGDIHQSFNFIKEESIDEIYCSLKELSNTQIKKFVDFCDENVKNLKFIPSQDDIFSKNLHLNYYDITPVLSLRKIPLDDKINAIFKRGFDIFFSLIVICFVLSWLIPILGLIIVLESRGPIFFRQNRPGIKEKGFGCYKFRSMTLNTNTEMSATRDDSRVTRVGKFIRRTSIDELPQFFNVLFGSMSVVGPRPHLWRQNEMYGKKISKYMVRYFVKPGITGLAQVSGYRGEIETKEDIVNRTKYDIFYVENWSILLDINIIMKTILNVIKGEEKAY